VWAGPAAWTSLRARLEERANRRTAWVEALIDEGYDALLVGFPESHCIGHQGWHLHDRAHERHDPALAAETGDVVRDVYRALDACVGRLVARAGPSTRVMVLASHGMGPHHDGGAALDGMLERLESLLPAGRPPTLLGRLGRRLDTKRTRRWNRSLAKRLGVRVPWPSRNGGRTCFVIPNNDAWAGIRVNVVGREPRGRIAPGAAYDAYLDALAARLGEVVHGETGEPVFTRIERTARLHQGPSTAAFPDLVAEWRRGRPIPSLAHPQAGSVRHPYHGIRSGDHRDYGMVVAAGPGIAPGTAPPARIEDLGPTIARWLDVDLPDVDGRPIAALCGADAATSR
jgi:predicted AlkP superfamily phosphohydrolase/phosphomutase